MIGKIKELYYYLSKLDKNKTYEITEYKPKRSLNANCYSWALINKIANVLRKSKEEVYLQMLKDYGQSEMVYILSSVDVTGYFKYYEEIGKEFRNGKEYTYYKVYKGSSEYNTKEMSILISGIIQEAQQLGIETLSPSKLSEFKKY